MGTCRSCNSCCNRNDMYDRRSARNTEQKLTHSNSLPNKTLNNTDSTINSHSQLLKKSYSIDMISISTSTSTTSCETISLRRVSHAMKHMELYTNNLNGEQPYCAKLPTMAIDTSYPTLLANPFCANTPTPSNNLLSNLKIGVYVNVQIKYVSEYGVRCNLCLYDIEGWITAENISHQINKQFHKLNRLFDNDITSNLYKKKRKEIVNNYLKNRTNLYAKIISMDLVKSNVHLSCLTKKQVTFNMDHNTMGI